MNKNEIEQLIKKNNKIEENMLKMEKNNGEEHIMTQKKKINPFIEVIDSSRLNDNIIDISENNYDFINEEKKEEEKIEIDTIIKNKDSINICQNSERNNNINEEPMTFNPKNKKNNIVNSINSNTSSNKTFITFNNEQNDEELNNKKDINKNIHNNNLQNIDKFSFKDNNSLKENDDLNSKSNFEQLDNINSFNENNCDNNINNIIEVLKVSIDKIKSYINQNNKINNNINNEIINKKILHNQIIDIKNNIIEVFDKIINNNNKIEQNMTDNINNSSNYIYNNSNYKNSYYQSPFKVNEKSIFQIPKDDINNNFYETNENFFSSFLSTKDLYNSYNNTNYNINKNDDNLLKKMYEVEEIEKIFRTQIVNLKKEIFLIKQENNNLKQIVQNLKKLMDELMNKNKLLSSKLIKYKTLYEEKNK